jgi:hypothetical protein
LSSQDLDPFSGPHVRSYASEGEALDVFLEDFQPSLDGDVAPPNPSKRSADGGAKRPKLDIPTLVYTGVRSEPISGHSWVLMLTDYGQGDVDCIAMRSTDVRSYVGGRRERKERREDMDPENLLRSQLRAKRKCRQRIMMLRADRMLTLTYRENQKDLSQAWKD